MKLLSEIIKLSIEQREWEGRAMTLLAVCPNSSAVLEAAVKVAAETRSVMLFAATRNQVDRDGGYTGWTPQQFTRELQVLSDKYNCHKSLYACLDHGGPWTKDVDSLNQLSLARTMQEVKASLTDCLAAGYRLLHIDTTVDRTLPAGRAPDINTVVDRTIELIAYSESERERMNLEPIDYEVGSDEVHGGLVEMSRFTEFLEKLQIGLKANNLASIWPCFIVTQVGTDLHTTRFDGCVARRLYEVVSPLGSLIKGHYTDWVENPAEYPASGMGGANVGPEFTSAEVHALMELEKKELLQMDEIPVGKLSNFGRILQEAVLASGRWKKWLQAEEIGLEFDELDLQRRAWLVETGARYIWMKSPVVEARQRLYQNLQSQILDPHGFVIDFIATVVRKYIQAFNLSGSAEK